MIYSTKSQSRQKTGRSHGGRQIVAISLLVAGASTGLLPGAAIATPALASPASPATPPGQSQASPPPPPPAERIAATTATFNAIEAKIAAGQSLRLRFPDPTAQEDIIDYGVNDLWQK